MVKQLALFIRLLVSLLLSAGAAAEAFPDTAAFCRAEDITPIAPEQGATAPAYTAGRADKVIITLADGKYADRQPGLHAARRRGWMLAQQRLIDLAQEDSPGFR